MQTFDYIIVGAGSAGCVLAKPLIRKPKAQGVAAGNRWLR